MIYKVLDELKHPPYYGDLCSSASCGFFGGCSSYPSGIFTWYPDKIKDTILTLPKGIKTCDNLLLKKNKIYLFEIKSKTRDIYAKLQGTYYVLQYIGCCITLNDLREITMYVVRCKSKNPNVSFRDSLDKLRQRNISSYIYDNNTYTISGVNIPIKYCRECSLFLRLLLI